MFIFMFKEFGLYPISNEVFLMGFQQGNIMIKVAFFFLTAVSMVNISEEEIKRMR